MYSRYKKWHARSLAECIHLMSSSMQKFSQAKTAACSAGRTCQCLIISIMYTNVIIIIIIILYRRYRKNCIYYCIRNRRFQMSQCSALRPVHSQRDYRRWTTTYRGATRRVPKAVYKWWFYQDVPIEKYY